MSNGEPHPTKRNQQLGVMVTFAEKEAVRRVAEQLGMTLSNAGRYLINRGLSVHDSSERDDQS